jgi:hypothetical protein
MSDKLQHPPDLDWLKAQAARRRGLSNRKRVARALLELIDTAHDRYRSDQHDVEILTAAGWTLPMLGEVMLAGEMEPDTLVTKVLNLFWPADLRRVDRNRAVSDMSVAATLALIRARNEPFARGFDRSEEEAHCKGSDPLVASVEPAGALRWLVGKGLMPPIAAALVAGRDPEAAVIPEALPAESEALQPAARSPAKPRKAIIGAEMVAWFDKLPVRQRKKNPNQLADQYLNEPGRRGTKRYACTVFANPGKYRDRV